MSILDINEQINDQTTEVMTWLDSFCTYDNLKPQLRPGTNIVDMAGINYYTLGTYVELNEDIKQIPDVFRFGNVDGSFNCDDCTELENCSGFPSEITGELIIRDCPKITSVPQFKSLGSFTCINMENLKEIGKLPEHLGGTLEVERCPMIEDLSWFPKRIGGNIWLQESLKTEKSVITITDTMCDYTDCYWVDNASLTSVGQMHKSKRYGNTGY